MNNIKFVAFDVETAAIKNPRFICQLGLSIVDMDNEIIETKSYYIQPPNNEIAPQLTKIHGITPDQTKDAPDFKTAWNEIKHLFNKTIVAHNASFDCSVLTENLKYYDLDESGLNDCKCTYVLFDRKLEDLCKGFTIEYVNHHNAGFDAECCAKFYINYLKGIEPNETLMPETVTSKKRSRSPYNPEDRLKGDILKQDLTNADPDNPFYDKKIVITGTFFYDRNNLAKKIKDMGADINTSISKQTNIVLVGEKPGPSKIKQIKSLQEEGYDIRVIQDFELDKIFDKY